MLIPTLYTITFRLGYNGSVARKSAWIEQAHAVLFADVLARRNPRTAPDGKDETLHREGK
jgi:hypothetical protein